jgi:hypothetical protein
MPLERTDNGLTYLAFSSKLKSPWNETRVYSVSRYYIQKAIVKRRLDNTRTYEALVTGSELSCRAYSMLYDVNISFPRGIRTIEHKISDPKAVPNAVDIYGQYVPGRSPRGIHLSTPADTHAVEEWRDKIFTALPVSNEWAILDALGAALDVAWYWENWESFAGSENCIQQDAFENGTTIDVCWSSFLTGSPSYNNTGCKSRATLH